jgi:tripartite ATP-independent transporter DctP family solute receptor
MKIRNCFVSCTFVGFLAVFLLPASIYAAEKKPVLLRLGHEMPESHPYHEGAKKFAEILNKKTSGEITIQIFPNGTLGKQAQLVDSLTMGTIDLSLTNTIVLEKYEPRMGVLSMPYIIRDWNQIYQAVDGEIGKELNKGLEKKGITVLAYHEIGRINMLTIKPVKHPDDVKGIKLRSQPGPSQIEAAKALGAVVVPTAYSEVYTALQLGTIDGTTQPPSNISQNKFYEVAKYYIINELSFFLEPLSMSQMVYDRMTPEHQKILREAAYESAVWQRAYIRAQQDKDLEFLEKNGVIVTKADVSEWRAIIEPTWDKFPQWHDLIVNIQAIK